MAWRTVFKVWGIVCGLIGCAAIVEVGVYYANGFRYKPPESIGKLELLKRTVSVDEQQKFAAGCISLIFNDPSVHNRTDVVIMDLKSHSAEMLGVERFQPRSVCLSRDGIFLAVGSSCDLPLLVDRRSNSRVRLSCPSEITAPVWKWAFCEKGEKLVGATSREVLCWEVASADLIWDRKLPDFKEILFSSDCQVLRLTNGLNRSLYLSAISGRDVDRNEAQAFEFHSPPTISLANLPFQTETGSTFYPLGDAIIH